MSESSRADGRTQAELLSKFAGNRFGVCGVVPAIRLGDALRLIATHAQPQARFLLSLVLISSLREDASDRAVHEAVDLVWDLTAPDDWADVRAHHDLAGEIVGFSQGIVETEDWADEIFAAVMIDDVSTRAEAIETVLDDVLQVNVGIERGARACDHSGFDAVRSYAPLTALVSAAANDCDPLRSYLVIASLVTNISQQCDEDGVALAVEYALDVFGQVAWTQARLVRDEHGAVCGFEDDVYDGMGLARAVGQAVLQAEVADRTRAVWGLIYLAVEDPPHDWGHEVASFLQKQRLHGEGGSYA